MTTLHCLFDINLSPLAKTYLVHMTISAKCHIKFISLKGCCLNLGDQSSSFKMVIVTVIVKS